MSDVGCHFVVILLATCLLDGLLNYSSTLKMEAIRSSETSGATQRTTRRHIPEDDTLQSRNSIKNYFPFFLFLIATFAEKMNQFFV
jgi:hypothetical protein